MKTGRWTKELWELVGFSKNKNMTSNNSKKKESMLYKIDSWISQCSSNHFFSSSLWQPLNVLIQKNANK